MLPLKDYTAWIELDFISIYIVYDMYQQNKCGFLIKRPLSCTKALEANVNNTIDTNGKRKT